MLKVGLTGGIACGKTSVAQWFADKQITVFDADHTVHELYAKPSMAEEIKKTFGSEYLENGVINRTLLADLVFKDVKARAKLEEMIHPLILKEMMAKCSQSELAGEQLIILDIPLLLEAGWEKYVDEVWIVYVSSDVQLQRLMQRNGLSGEKAGERVSSQMPLAEKVKMAYRVIDNSGSWPETEKQMEVIWRELKERFPKLP